MGLVKLFSQAYGNAADEGGITAKLMQLGKKILFWIILTFIFWILYFVLYLTQCTKPLSGTGTCLLQTENKDLDTFELDLSQMLTGGQCNDENSYNNPGQTVDWIDTGYITNGKQLIVYANGEYYPWGEEQTSKETNYHVMQVKDNNGNFNSVLQITYGPKECELNTDISYHKDDSQETKVVYLNQFNQYTNWNVNNRSKTNKGKVLYNTGQQADCIANVNCQFGESEDNQSSCVLKNGAGIYMKIGNDSTVAYHIKNYFVPEFKQECTTSGYCKLMYKTSNNGNDINLVQIPFALPPVIYNPYAKKDTYMYDIRDDVLQNLSIITKTENLTDYRFTTIELDPETPIERCDGYKQQVIGGNCYKQVEKNLTLEELQTPHCIYSSLTDINLANELCAPQNGKKIWIKPADTCYEDNTGKIKLTFASGVVSHSKQISYQHNGLRLSFITSFISSLFTPFFGSQKDLVDPEEVIYVKQPEEIKEENSRILTLCRDDGGELFLSKLEKDWFLRTEKYGTSGIKIRDIYSKDFSDEFKTSITMDAKYIDDLNGKKSCVEFMFKKDYNKTTEDIEKKKIIRANTMLVRIADLDSGMFVQIRTAIMKSSLYNIARILFVVWFVFSFGVGFLNKQKLLSRVPLISSDWKRFLILLWCSDPNNYDLIDEMLWPALFYGAQSVAEGIVNAVSGVYGTSITSDNPLEFFDEVVASLTSKELFYKLGAIATSDLSFVMFFFIFPFLISSIKDLLLAILGPIVSLSFTLFNVGSIIMFMPMYAVISLLGTKKLKDTFTKSIKMLIGEFIHFAFELGFFGLCIGFCYHYFLEAVNLKVCWINKINFKLLWIIPIKLSDWQICTGGSTSQASIAERFSILWDMIMNIFKFQIVVMVMGKLSITIADMLANIFAKGGGIVSVKKANSLFDAFANTAVSALGQYDKYTSKIAEEDQEAETMNKKNRIKKDNERQRRDDRYNNRAKSISRGNNYYGNEGDGQLPINQNEVVSRTNETNSIYTKSNLNNDKDNNYNYGNSDNNYNENVNNVNSKIEENNNDKQPFLQQNSFVPQVNNINDGDAIQNNIKDNYIINKTKINKKKKGGAGIRENEMYIKEGNAGLKDNTGVAIRENNAEMKDWMNENKDDTKEKEIQKLEEEIKKENKIIDKKNTMNKGLDKEIAKINEQTKLENDLDKINKNEKLIQQIETSKHNNENIIKQNKNNAYNNTKKLKKLK